MSALHPLVQRAQRLQASVQAVATNALDEHAGELQRAVEEDGARSFREEDVQQPEGELVGEEVGDGASQSKL